MVELSSMVVPGVQLVAKLAGKIPGYKALAKIGVKNTARKTVKAAARGVGAIANGVGAIKSGVEVVGKKSRNVARGTRRGLARVGRFFGMKSRKAGRSRSCSRSKSKKSPSRRRNSNRKVKFAPNVRNTANAKPVVRKLTPAPAEPIAAPAPALAPMPAPAPAPAVVAKPLSMKNLNSPVGTAVANISPPPPKPY